MDIKKVLSFAIGPVSSAILGFVSLPVLAWYFSAEDIGRISMLQVVVNFAIILFSLGLDQAYVREYHESENKAVLLRTAVFPGFLLLTVAILGIQLFAPKLLAELLFNIDNSLFSFLVCVCLLSSLLSRFLSLILRMQEKGLAFSMSQVLPKILFLLVIVFYIFSGTVLSFQKLLIAQVLSIVAVFLIFSWNTRIEWVPTFYSKIDYSELQSMCVFGFPLIFGGIASWMLIAMDRMFLRSLSSFEELGIYSVASSVAAAVGILSSIFSTLWAPTVFKWAAAGDNFDIIDKISEHALAAVYFALCLTGAFSWVIPHLLPKMYVPVQFLVTSCVIVPLFYMLSEITAVGIAITRKTSLSLIASFTAAVFNAIGNYWLVPRYGAVGAAVSTAFAFWIFMVCRTEFCCLVWRSVPRLKLYIVTLVCLSGSILFALVGIKYSAVFTFFWVSLFFIGIFLFRVSISFLKVKVFTLLRLG